MRAVCYARVSSKVQKDRQTVENQLRVLPDFVERQGWTLARPPTTYVDDGRTAKAGHLEKRDALARLMADAAAGAFDVVAVVDLDRLTRSEDITERGQVIGAFQRAGIRIAIATSGQVLDLSSSMGDLFSGLQAFFAAEENRKRRERTVAGKLRAIADGKKPSGPTPFGYAYDREAGWSIHEDQAAVVREIFRRVANGESCEAIALSLDERAIPRPRTGRWLRERVWQIAIARTYIGQWTADRARGLVVPVPPIVSEATWTAAQRTLTRHRKRGIARAKHVYLLGGLGICEWCEARVGISTGSGPDSGKRRQTYYVCCQRRRPSRHRDRCLLPFHNAAQLDERLWSVVVDAISRRDLLDGFLASRADAKRKARSTWRDDLAAAETALEKLTRAESAILARFRSGRITEAALDIELAAQAEERARHEARAAAARAAGLADVPTGAEIRSLAETIEGVRRLVRRTEAEDRRRIVAALLGQDGVVFGPEHVSATLKIRTGQIHASSSATSQMTSPLVLEVRIDA